MAVVYSSGYTFVLLKLGSYTSFEKVSLYDELFKLLPKLNVTGSLNVF